MADCRWHDRCCFPSWFSWGRWSSRHMDPNRVVIVAWLYYIVGNWLSLIYSVCARMTVFFWPTKYVPWIPKYSGILPPISFLRLCPSAFDVLGFSGCWYYLEALKCALCCFCPFCSSVHRFGWNKWEWLIVHVIGSDRCMAGWTHMIVCTLLACGCTWSSLLFIICYYYFAPSLISLKPFYILYIFCYLNMVETYIHIYTSLSVWTKVCTYCASTTRIL